MKIGGFLAYRQSKYQYTMADLFNGVQFAKFTSTYERAPIEQFAKSAEILNNRWEENKAAKDQIDIALSNIKVEDIDNPVIKARINVVKDQFKDVVNSNAYENAGSVVKNATVGFLTDKAVKAATTNYEARQKTKEEIRARFDAGKLSATQYQDRVRRFQNYSGIGTPDELGFYQDYTFEHGPNRVDLQDFATQALANAKTDTFTNQSTRTGYASPEEQMLGIGSTQNTSEVRITDGGKLKFSLADQMKNDPNVMAYIQDEVRIQNESNPNGKPITVDDYIEDYATDYVTKYSGVDKANSSTELRDRDEWIRSRAGKKQEADFAGWDSIPFDGKTTIGTEDAVLNYLSSTMQAKNKSAAYSLDKPYPFTLRDIFGAKITPEQQARLDNLKSVLGSEDAVRAYLSNTKKVGISNTYQRYSNDMSKEKTTELKNNMASRSVYDPETGKIITGSEFDRMINSKSGGDAAKTTFAVVGRPSVNNTYYDQTQRPDMTRPYAVTFNGKFYMVGMAKDEMDINGAVYSIYNRLTLPYRSGRKTIITLPGSNKGFYAQHAYQNGRSIYLIYDKNNKGLGTVDDVGKDRSGQNMRSETDVANDFINLVTQ